MGQPIEPPKAGLNIYSEIVQEPNGQSVVKLHISFGPMVTSLQMGVELAEKLGPTIADVLRPAIEQARRNNSGIIIAGNGQLPPFPPPGGLR